MSNKKFKWKIAHINNDSSIFPEIEEIFKKIRYSQIWKNVARLIYLIANLTILFWKISSKNANVN